MPPTICPFSEYDWILKSLNTKNYDLKTTILTENQSLLVLGGYIWRAHRIATPVMPPHVGRY